MGIVGLKKKGSSVMKKANKALIPPWFLEVVERERTFAFTFTFTLIVCIRH